MENCIACLTRILFSLQLIMIVYCIVIEVLFFLIFKKYSDVFCVYYMYVQVFIQRSPFPSLIHMNLPNFLM